MGKCWNQPQHIIDAIRQRQMGEGNSFYGKHHTDEHKRRIRKLLKGREKPKGFAEKIGELKKGNKNWLGKRHTKETREKMSQSAKKTLTKALIKKRLARRIPTSFELKFENIVRKNKLPYRFVGNGSFIIERYNPDFVNTNGKKIAIEVYASYHKKKHTDDIERWKKERSNVFSKYGWKVFYFDETQINEDYVLGTLLDK